MTGRQGSRCRQLLDYLKERRKKQTFFQQVALDRSVYGELALEEAVDYVKNDLCVITKPSTRPADRRYIVYQFIQGT